MSDLAEIKEAYNKGYKDGQEALAVHLELCKEEEEPTAKENLVVGDCISRKAVMDCFKKWQPYMATRIFEYEQELKALPSVQPKSKTDWIPVSERLPYNHEYIQNNGLFNVSDGNRSYSEWFDIYDTQKFGEPTMSGFRVDYAVTAWMPLPEPYKAEKER